MADRNILTRKKLRPGPGNLLALAVCLLAACLQTACGQVGRKAGKVRQPFQEPDLGERFSPRLGTLVPNIDDAEGEIKVIEGRARLLRTRAPVFRTHIADPGVADVVQFEPKQLSLLGQSRGATTMTLWFEDEPKPLTVQVRVVRDPELESMRQRDYSILEAQLNEMFPNSHIRLVPVADKVVLMGEARDTEEAAKILSIVTAGGGGGWAGAGNAGPTGTNATGWTGWGGGGGAFVAGTAAPPFPGQMQFDGSVLINMLRIPGEQTVMIKVTVAELNRSAVRDIGTNLNRLDFNLGRDVQLFLSSLMSGDGNVTFQIDSNDVDIDAVVKFLASNGTLRILAQGTAVTLSGRWGSFLAGSEFAVPTALGLTGGQTTSFRGVGFNIDFLPTVVDKDLIRLVVVPEFSQPNTGLAVGGIPGVDTRSLFTTVELREGQTYAVATLVQDTTENENTRIPFIGDVPWLGTLFSARHSSHSEQELIMLVTPELVSPMEPDEVPPLPGYDVTEPTDKELYFYGRTEGHPGSHWRSPIWPINWTRIRDYMDAEQYHVAGPTGHAPPSAYDGPVVDGPAMGPPAGVSAPVISAPAAPPGPAAPPPSPAAPGQYGPTGPVRPGYQGAYRGSPQGFSRPYFGARSRFGFSGNPYAQPAQNWRSSTAAPASGTWNAPRTAARRWSSWLWRR